MENLRLSRTVVLAVLFVSSATAFVATSLMVQADIGGGVNGGGGSSDDDSGFRGNRFCGDGQKNGDEECDEGGSNGVPGSGCSFTCRKVEKTCGNGSKEGSEECDDGNFNDMDGCTNMCTRPVCGDNIVQYSNGEECDNGSRNGDPTSNCNSTCLFTGIGNPSECGNGIQEGIEDCDDGNRIDDDRCSNDCFMTFCGDGIVQASSGEECDDLADPACNNCTYDSGSNTSDPAAIGGNGSGYCGNGIIDEGEECDGGESNGSDICTFDCYIPIETGDDDDIVDSNLTDPPVPPTDIDPSDPRDATVDAAELLRRRKAVQEALEERMKQAQENREEESSNTSESGSEDDDEEKTVIIDTDDGLVCFDEQGKLVEQRSLCGAEQGQYLRPEVTISAEEIEHELNDKFLGDDVTAQRRSELLSTLQTAKEKLQVLQTLNHNSQEVRDYFDDSVDWIDRGIDYFSEVPRNIEEIEQMVEPVRQLLSQARELVESEKDLPSVNPEIDPILEKTERLLEKFRESFVALARGGIELDQHALEQYVEASNLYMNVKDSCMEDDMSECTRLNEVLELMAQVQVPLQRDLGENLEIYEKVQAKFGN